MDRISLGFKGENIVSEYLKKDNFTILENNYRSKCGEIDIIAQKDDLIVFVEVKLRNNPKFSLSNLIPRSKQAKIIMTALNYLATHNITLQNNILRFDAALVEVINDKINLNYIKNAFTRPE